MFCSAVSFSALLIRILFNHTHSGSDELLFNKTCLIPAFIFLFLHQIEGAKDFCHRARSSEPLLRSAVTPACFTCRASLASRPPPHSGERAKCSRMYSAEAFLHIPHICLWFTEQVTSPACLNSCSGVDASPPPPPPSTS